MQINKQEISDKIINALTGATPQTALTLISSLNLDAIPFTVVTVIDELLHADKIKIVKNEGRGYNGIYYAVNKGKEK